MRSKEFPTILLFMKLFNNPLHTLETDINSSSSEQEIEKLKNKRKGLSTNYNLAALLILLFVYYIYDARKDGTGPIWLFVILGILIILAGLIIWYDLKTIKKIDKEIKNIKEKSAKKNNIDENKINTITENESTTSNDNLE